MSRLYSVEQVSELLGLHVKTVRNYVRDGRLPAVRVGKQYRISGEDLAAFTGRPVSTSGGRERPAEVSSIVRIEGIDRVAVDRLTTLVLGSAGSRQAGLPLRVETVYDEARATLKIIVLGGLADTAALLTLMDAVGERE